MTSPSARLASSILQIAMFIGFLEYVISQIVLKPGYIPGDYVGANDLFSEEGPHSQWDDFQVRNFSALSLNVHLVGGGVPDAEGLRGAPTCHCLSTGAPGGPSHLPLLYDKAFRSRGERQLL